jgi:hypothetical protein
LISKRSVETDVRSISMRKVLRGYAKDQNGNLLLIGTIPVPHSKDKSRPRERKAKRYLVRLQQLFAVSDVSSDNNAPTRKLHCTEMEIIFCNNSFRENVRGPQLVRLNSSLIKTLKPNKKTRLGIRTRSPNSAHSEKCNLISPASDRSCRLPSQVTI